MDSAYDFETCPDRRGTSSVKWDYGKRYVGQDDLLPMWVADMDIRLPPEIQTAIERRVSHGVFGYTAEPESYFEAARGWLARRHGANVEREWMRPSPGVLASLSGAIHAFTAPGDAIVIQPPVYYPFAKRVRENGRSVVENPLERKGNRYEMDLEGLKRALDRGARMLVLCSPHNPVSRVWPGELIAEVVRLCSRAGVVVVSDEIHADLVQPDHPHTPAFAASVEARTCTVTLLSATKTFNLAGLGGALSIVPDRDLRRKLEAAERAWFPGIANSVAVVAAEAAWREGEQWLDALLRHVRSNYDVLRAELGRRIPQAVVAPLEGTYLAWIDVSALGLSDDEAIRRMRGPGGVWLDEGRKFGAGGQGFHRMNLACPRPQVLEAVARMERTLRG